MVIFVDYSGRRHDFKASHDLLVEVKSVVRVKCFEYMIDRLVKAGRTKQVIGFFERMEKDYGFKKDKKRLEFVVKSCVKMGMQVMLGKW